MRTTGEKRLFGMPSPRHDDDTSCTATELKRKTGKKNREHARTGRTKTAGWRNGILAADAETPRRERATEVVTHRCGRWRRERADRRRHLTRTKNGNRRRVGSRRDGHGIRKRISGEEKKTVTIITVYTRLPAVPDTVSVRYRGALDVWSRDACDNRVAADAVNGIQDESTNVRAMLRADASGAPIASDGARPPTLML